MTARWPAGATNVSRADAAGIAQANELPLIERETGIGLGLKVCPVTAAGATVDHPRQYRRAEKQLAKAQRRLARRKQRSRRWWKAARLLARKHHKVKRQRRDFYHKTALALLRTSHTPYDLQNLPPPHLS